MPTMIVCDQHIKKHSQIGIGEVNHVSTYDFAIEEVTSEHHDFIKKYEWLGSMGVNPKWLFTARDSATPGVQNARVTYEDDVAVKTIGKLVALVGLNEPNAYSKVIDGTDPVLTQCLIQRGASSNLAHIHTGSKLISFAIDWMVKNTPKRIFFGYSDQRAGEIGQIYSACNFEFMGWNFGTDKMYIHPTFMDGKAFSTQIFNRTAWIKKFLKSQGISWDPKWSKSNGFKDLKAIPKEIINLPREYGRTIIKESRAVSLPPKGKWILVRGKDKKEQRKFDKAKLYKSHPHPRRDDPKLLEVFNRWKNAVDGEAR